MSELLISIFIHFLFFDHTARGYPLLIIFNSSNNTQDQVDQIDIQDREDREEGEDQDLSPRIRRANCMSLGKIVTLLA